MRRGGGKLGAGGVSLPVEEAGRASRGPLLGTGRCCRRAEALFGIGAWGEGRRGGVGLWELGEPVAGGRGGAGGGRPELLVELGAMAWVGLKGRTVISNYSYPCSGGTGGVL